MTIRGKWFERQGGSVDVALELVPVGQTNKITTSGPNVLYQANRYRPIIMK